MKETKKPPFDKDRYKAKLSEKGLTIDFSKDDIINNLPHLASELLDPVERSVFSLNEYKEDLSKEPVDEIERDSSVELNENSTPEQVAEYKEKIKEKVSSNYDEDSELYYPKTEDFIRRCSTIEEAIEIIDHQLKMKEISESEADRLKKICREKGVRHFGEKKEYGYYERKYRS